MRLSDRAHMIDTLAVALKHEVGEAVVSKVMNGFRYTLALKAFPDTTIEDEIGWRISQFHKDRGCCDGVDVTKCPRLGEQPKVEKRARVEDEFEGTGND